MIWSRINLFNYKLIFVLYILICYQQLNNVNASIRTIKEKPIIQSLEIISQRGFLGEMYQVKSIGGGTLIIYHLINPLANSSTLNKYPILVGHGLFGDAALTLSNSKNSKPRKPLLDKPTFEEGDECIPFSYSNNNFDVWLYDSRATNFYNHKAEEDLISSEGKKFYNFSFDEQSLEDLPAFIDFILEHTKSEKIFYSGYSSTSMTMLALLSGRPEYQTKVSGAVLLGAFANLTHIRGLFSYLMPFFYTITNNVIGNVFPDVIDDIIPAHMRRLCSLNGIMRKIYCEPSVKVVAGRTDKILIEPNFYSAYYKGTSIRSLRQLAQFHYQDRFGMYDFGSKENLIRYGQERPPDYDLGKIKETALILVRCGNDHLASPENQQIFLPKLGAKPYLDIYLPDYNHLDVQLGSDSIERIRKPVVNALFALMKTEQPNGNKTILNQNTSNNTRNHRPILTAKPNYKEPFSSEPIQIPINLFNSLVEAFGEKQFIRDHMSVILKPMKKLAFNLDNFIESSYKFILSDHIFNLEKYVKNKVTG